MDRRQMIKRKRKIKTRMMIIKNGVENVHQIALQLKIVNGIIFGVCLLTYHALLQVYTMQILAFSRKLKMKKHGHYITLKAYS